MQQAMVWLSTHSCSLARDVIKSFDSCGLHTINVHIPFQIIEGSVLPILIPRPKCCYECYLIDLKLKYFLFHQVIPFYILKGSFQDWIMSRLCPLESVVFAKFTASPFQSPSLPHCTKRASPPSHPMGARHLRR